MHCLKTVSTLPVGNIVRCDPKYKYKKADYRLILLLKPLISASTSSIKTNFQVLYQEEITGMFNDINRTY